MQSQTGSEYNNLHPKEKHFKLNLVKPTNKDTSFLFVSKSNLLILAVTGSYELFKQDKFRGALIPDNATVTPHPTIPNVYCADKIILSEKIHLIELFDKWEFTTEDIIEAIAKCPKVLNIIPPELITEELCATIVMNDAMALKNIPRELITSTLCMVAVTSNRDAFEFVPEKFRSNEILKRAGQVRLTDSGIDRDTVDDPRLSSMLDALDKEKEAEANLPPDMRTEIAMHINIEHDPKMLIKIPIHLRTKSMCYKAAIQDPAQLKFVPPLFIDDEFGLSLAFFNKNCIPWLLDESYGVPNLMSEEALDKLRAMQK